jgi:thiol-disulfide isomerase/thioredoxin
MTTTITSQPPGDESILRTRWFWAVAIVVVILLGSGWILISRPISSGSEVANAPAPMPGHPAPEFALKNLSGQAVRLSDFKGKPVLINFWASWCGPCRSEFPDLQRASVDNAGKLVIIGVNHTTLDQPAVISGFVAEMGATFPIVLDETGEVAKTYQIKGLPTVNKAFIEAKLKGL